jgi:hypothetical protein
MSRLRLQGATSGFVELAAPDVSDDGVLTLPTAAQGILAGNGGIGSNVVQTVKTDTFSTTSTSFAAVTGMSVTITPTSNTSKILLIVSCNLSTNNASDVGALIRIIGGNATTFVGDEDGSRARVATGLSRWAAGTELALFSHNVVYLDNPATTSATTYQLEMLTPTSATTAFLNRTGDTTDAARRPRGASSIIAIEVAA